MNCKKVYDIPKSDLRTNESSRRVYSAEAIAPSVTTICGGNQEPKILASCDKDSDNGERLVLDTECLNSKVDGKQPSLCDRVYSTDGVSMAMTTADFFMGKIADTGKKRLRIRKLTEDECMRLMGFEEADTKAMRDAGLSKANIYHSAGDSIVTTVLVALLGSLIGADYETIIREWSDKLRNETL